MSESLETQFGIQTGSTKQQHADAALGAEVLNKMTGICSKVPTKLAPYGEQYAALSMAMNEMASLDKGGVRAAIATDHRIRNGNKTFSPSSVTLFATDPTAPTDPLLSTPMRQAMFHALRLTPVRLKYVFGLADLLAKHDLPLAVKFLGCHIPRPCSGGAGAFKSGDRCELPFCKSCNASRGRALSLPMAETLVQAGYAGRQVEAIVLTQQLRPRESAAEAYHRLNKALTPKLRALKGRNGLERLDLIAPCFENVINEHGASHFHIHMIAAWNEDLAGDLVDRLTAFWRLEVGQVKRVPLFRKFKGSKGLALSLAEMAKRVAYHRKANVRVKDPTEPAIAALAQMAKDLKGVKLRRKIWMEPTLNRVWGPTSGMAHVHFLNDTTIGFFKVRAS